MTTTPAAAGRSDRMDRARPPPDPHGTLGGEPVRDPLLDAQLLHLCRQAPIAIAANLALLPVIVTALSGSVPTAPLVTWASLLAVMTILRWGIVREYTGAGPGAGRRIVRRFSAATLVSGTLWGASALLFLPVAPPRYDWIIVIAIAGLASAAMPLLACIRRLYFAYLACILVPLGLWFLHQGGSPPDLGLFAMTLLFGASLALTGHNHATQFARSHRLASQLRRANRHMEEASRKLRAEMDESLRIQAALRSSQAQFETAFDHAPIGMALVRPDGRLLKANPMLAELLGEEHAALSRRRLGELILDEDAAGVAASMETMREGPETRAHMDVRFVRRDGDTLWAAVGAAFVQPDDNADGHFIIEVQDITDSVQLSARLQYEATHDALTGLTNRREFERRLTRLMASVRDGETEHTLCYLDLDRFKVINDSQGHVAGDEVLRQIAATLQEQLRTGDLIARIGGDEFAVLLEHCDMAGAARVANGLVRAVNEFRFQWNGELFQLDLSVGITAIAEYHQSISDVLREADTACTIAKEAGGARSHTFHLNDADVKRRHGEIAWLARITRALEQDGFELYAQPIVPVTPGLRSEGEYFEVLLRMHGAGDEPLMPSAFLPAAERYGLATRVDRWVVDAVIGWFTNNPASAAGVQSCAINLSGASLGDEEFAEYLVQAVSAAPLAPAKLHFEITETAAISHLPQARSFMRRIKALGCRFSLDDFGSGLSSFGYLRSLPVDTLKIDGQFVRDLRHDRVDRALVKSINDVGLVLGLRTVAEFVEDDTTLAILRDIGVDYAQGHHVGRPRPLYTA